MTDCDKIRQLPSRLPMWLVLTVAALMLSPALFMGLDVCDSGFYLTFYDNFFDAPATVEYNFMYCLSGFAGGVAQMVSPSWSMLWMRLTGLVAILASVAMIYAAYDGLVSRKSTAIGLLCVILGYVSSPLTLSYDIMTLLLLVGGIVLILKGLRRDRGMYMFVAGVLIGMNLFVRVPNVLQFFLIAVIAFSGEAVWSRRRWLMLWFAGGYLGGIAAIWLLMTVTGVSGVFIENLQTLRGVSGDGEASHGISSLIHAQIAYYRAIMILLVKFAVLAAYSLLAGRIPCKWLRLLSRVPAVVYLTYILLHTAPVAVLAAVTLPALTVLSVRRGNPAMTDAVRAALLAALIFPLGSDGAGYNVGSILFLAGAPFAFSFWRHMDLPHIFRRRHFPARAVAGCTALFAMTMVYTLCRGGLYFDDTPLWRMTAAVDSPRAAGILTSPERAEALNALLPRLEHHVSPGDTLLAYGSIPLVNYLTGTRPYMGISWPEQLSAQRLGERLDSASEVMLPVVCVQRFATIGSSWGIPSDAFVEGTDERSNVYHSAAKWHVLSDFLKKHGYRRMDGTSRFDIYIPPTRQ